MTTDSPSKDLAIKYALENNWEDAYSENKMLLDLNPDDVDTLNRTAYSLVKLNRLNEAKILYERVISIDKTNPIAMKNLRRIEAIENGVSVNESNTSKSLNGASLQNVFIEEAGKTKTIELKNVADKKTLSVLQPGDIVLLTIKRLKVFVQMPDKTFIGMLPDSVGMRMVPLLNGGNEYEGCIKALGDNSVTVFIKETKRMPKFKNYPSFVLGTPIKTR